VQDPTDDVGDPNGPRPDRNRGVAELWAAYLDEPTQERRAELVVHYAPLVKYVAGRMSASMPPSIERADLVSYGVFGLIDAIDRFRSDRRCKFETYAISRIRGAILDELRRLDWVPRSVRAKAGRVQWAITELEAMLQRSPTDAELARFLGTSPRDLRATLTQIFSSTTTALEELTPDAGTTQAATAVADSDDEPAAVVDAAAMRDIVAATIKSLPERERTVLSLYYYENLTLAEIGSIMGVTESRVCQVHARAVLQMRSRIESQVRLPANRLSA
jgi:RNA polymerase sigma factor for flagellar operon FliA